ncbi:TetR/AcrR family transcriptional regulator [Nocardiopsis alba]|uniref:TetR/AcrR family transcriptional regulator n=1 Tax=Nocardiopsis alba TaxID=53437 RepID=UPI0033F0D574
MSTTDRRARERELRHRLILDKARALAETEGWDAVTTRRLSTLIEYSQPVLYDHFRNRDAIIAAIAVEGFAELADVLDEARSEVPEGEPELSAVVRAYMRFAEAGPAVYEAMFGRDLPLAFAVEETPEPLKAAFAVILEVVAPHADGRDPETLAEVVWASVHGLVTLRRDHRLRPGEEEARAAALVELIGGRKKGG